MDNMFGINLDGWHEMAAQVMEEHREEIERIYGQRVDSATNCNAVGKVEKPHKN
jgi:hypothetical protein